MAAAQGNIGGKLERLLDGGAARRLLGVGLFRHAISAHHRVNAFTSSSIMPVSRWRNASALSSSARISASTSAYFFLPMVRLHTMATRAAPMAPMMAATLPPPGVAFWLARSSRNLSMALCLIMRSGHLLGESVDLLGVEHGFRGVEQLADAGAMQLQFEAADAERAEGELAEAVLALVGRLDAFDAERRLGVHVGNHLDVGIVLPGRERQELQPDGASGIDDIGVLDRSRAGRIVGGLDRLHLHPEPLLDRLGRVVALLLRARGDGDVGALLAEQSRCPHADRPGAGEYHRLLALELLRLGEKGDAGRRRGV